MKRSTVGGYLGDGNKKVLGVLLPSCKRSKAQFMLRLKSALTLCPVALVYVNFSKKLHRLTFQLQIRECKFV